MLCYFILLVWCVRMTHRYWNLERSVCFSHRFSGHSSLLHNWQGGCCWKYEQYQIRNSYFYVWKGFLRTHCFVSLKSVFHESQWDFCTIAGCQNFSHWQRSGGCLLGIFRNVPFTNVGFSRLIQRFDFIAVDSPLCSLMIVSALLALIKPCCLLAD